MCVLGVCVCVFGGGGAGGVYKSNKNVIAFLSYNLCDM